MQVTLRQITETASSQESVKRVAPCEVMGYFP